MMIRPGKLLDSSEIILDKHNLNKIQIYESNLLRANIYYFDLTMEPEHHSVSHRFLFSTGMYFSIKKTLHVDSQCI